MCGVFFLINLNFKCQVSDETCFYFVFFCCNAKSEILFLILWNFLFQTNYFVLLLVNLKSRYICKILSLGNTSQLKLWTVLCPYQLLGEAHGVEGPKLWKWAWLEEQLFLYLGIFLRCWAWNELILLGQRLVNLETSYLLPVTWLERLLLHPPAASEQGVVWLNTLCLEGGCALQGSPKTPLVFKLPSF